ncbi:MAG: recombinase family protein [Ruminococcus sp.]|nr:recombinase family protein [Ruminococcus sp.]
MVKKEAEAIKRVRILLRVSSSQQLEADGDLNVQRQLVLDYIHQHDGWRFDGKEYFEGGISGYKNSVEDRGVLQEAYKDAENKEYDILVVYKDDRIGRRMWEIGAYVMTLKNLGVDIYTVKDGCISPETNDIMGQMILALRYGNAQKSSSDTGMRVKDTAQKLVAGGKFMGGKAPYGYILENSGEVSKHGRLLKKMVICPDESEVVKYIYNLSLNMEFGSVKIAKILNENEEYRRLAPDRKNWKGGTITSILTNPIYSGRVAYKRRERINGGYRTLKSKDWIIANEPNETIRIIDDDIWNRVQDKRALRAGKYTKKLEKQNAAVISRNDGMLPLIDIIHCGYCGCKMVNGSKYNYWTIKDTGERRTSKIPIYKCSQAWQGVPHDKTKRFRADKIDTIIFKKLAGYIERLQENEDIFKLIEQKQNGEKQKKESELVKEQKGLEKTKSGIAVMNSKIPEAMTGGYALTIEELSSAIKEFKKQEQKQQDKINQIKAEIKRFSVSAKEWETIRQKLPTWREIFLNTDVSRKRVLANKLIERIDIRKDNINIRFRIDLNEFLRSRMSMGHGVSEPRI